MNQGADAGLSHRRRAVIALATLLVAATSCQNSQDQRATSGTTRSAAGTAAPASKEWLADIDGDGRPDRLRLDDDRQLVARLTSRRSEVRTESPSLDVNFPLAILRDRRTGAAGVVVHAGGETWSTAAVAVLRGDQLVLLYPEVTIGWEPHSNCCPLATAGVTCTRTDRADSLTVTRSEVIIPKADAVEGNAAIYKAGPSQRVRKWERWLYQLEDGSLLVVSHDRGEIRDDRLTGLDVPLHNTLDCPPVPTAR